MTIPSEDIERCETHSMLFVCGEQCPVCNPWQHNNPRIKQEVELKGMELIGTISAIEGKWYTIEIDGKFFGKFALNEIKPNGERNE